MVLLAAICAAGAEAQPSCAAALPRLDRVLRQDAQDRTTRSYQAEQGLRDFALYSYRNIANDTIDGYGPFLDAVNGEFGFACADAAARTVWLRGLLAASPGAADFARRLVVAHDLMQQAAAGR